MVSLRYIRVLVLLVVSLNTCFVIAEQNPSKLAQPTEKVILELKGSIKATNDKQVARLDYDMLKSLGLVSLKINTPWSEDGSEFEGVYVRDLLKLVGAEGTEIVAEAVNGYSVVIPFADLVNYDTLLALSMNGKRLSLRDRGPSWILYSNSNHPDHPDIMLHSRMIWQLRSLTVQ